MLTEQLATSNGGRIDRPGNRTAEHGQASGEDILKPAHRTSFAFADVVARLPALARAEGSVLISGETGTGRSS